MKNKKPNCIDSSLLLSIKSSLLACMFMVLGFCMSIMAEPFEQETGMGISILGYNRDWLVSSRGLFVAGFVLCLFMAYCSWRKINKDY